MQTMALAIPVLAPIWSRPPADFTLAVTALNFGAVIGSAFIAPLGDKYSRRRIVGILLLTNGMFVAATATASTVTALVIWRFLAGLCLGAAIVNITVVITVRFPPDRQAMFLTIAATNLSLGGVVGGFANAPITKMMTWRGIFAIGGVAGVLVAFFLYANLSASKSRMRTIVADARRSHANGRISVTRLLVPGVRGITVPLWVTSFLNTTILFVLLGWLPTMLRDVRWSLADASRGSAYMQVGGIMGGLAISWLLDHGRSNVALWTVFTAMTVVFLAFLVAPPVVLVWSLLLVLGGGFCLAAHYALNALAATIYPIHMRATATGWANALSRIGSIGGSALGGILVHWHVNVASMIALLALPAILCLTLVGMLNRGRKRCEAFGF